MRLIDADALFPYGAVPFITNDGFATAEKVKEIIAKAPTVFEWIPVEERLPGQYKTVLVWTKHKEMGEAEYDGEFFVWMDDDGINDYAHATYWMPLPKPPEE